MPDRKSMEFVAMVDEAGKIALPENIIREVGRQPLHVRLTTRSISSELMNRRVSEDEIERISAIQLESREQVIKFLLTEGSLQKTSVRRPVR